MARWQSGYAAACKAVYVGSIPILASTFKIPTTLRLTLYITKIELISKAMIADTNRNYLAQTLAQIQETNDEAQEK